MSEHAVDLPNTLPGAAPSRGWWAAVERFLENAGDRLNPILVKETRQALKSRQFTITFVLLLVVAWGWSMVGLAMLGTEAAYGVQQGQSLFTGYYVILAFCLVVIVPFGALRSLSVEQEERTYEMLCITTLSPGQIVSGKLGSAILQMLIYLSAISPCLAFTYMLRGIDFLTILFILFYTILTSLGFSLVGLLVGTLTDAKHWQTVLAVLAIFGLLIAFFLSCSATFEGALSYSIPFTQSEFWLGLASVLTGYLSYFALFFFATAAQLTFASDNRSTRLRVVMLVQYLLFAGWMGWGWITESFNGEILFIFFLFCGLHWYVMGSLMIGESPDLSLRVRRRLPRSFLGRVLLTWFNPGPGTGYMFAVGGMAATLVVAAVAYGARLLATDTSRTTRISPETAFAFGVAGFCYLTIFLGLGLLLQRLLRRFFPAGQPLSVMLQVILVALASLVPWVAQMSFSRWYSSNYTLLQISNPFWTLTEIVDTRAGSSFMTPIVLLLSPAALLVFFLNLRRIVREVRFVREAKPARVAEEDAQQAAVLHPPQPVQISPWDVKLPSEPDR